MSNDFAVTIKPAFEFLAHRGYRLTYEDVSSSFDNGSLIYEGEGQRVTIERDRGQVSFTMRSRTDYHDVDEEILRLLLADASHYRKPESGRQFTVESSATFLRTNLSTLEGLFAASRVQETIRRAEALKIERAEALFGPLEQR